MNRFTIKDIENLSNIKAHTWRIWEQRYRLIMPHRKESKHRLYDNNDLKKILLIAYLYQSGIKISHIASIDEKQMEQIAADNISTENLSAYLLKQLTEAAIDFNEPAFTNVFAQSIKEQGIKKTILEVLYPFLNKIGMLWITNHIIPAQEHFCSNLVMHQLFIAIDQLPTVTNAKSEIVLFTPEEENHEIPLLFIYYLLKENGIKVIYLGPNISIEVLEGLYQKKPFSQMLFHLITNLSGKNIDAYLEKLADTFPKTSIAMSGPETVRVNKKPGSVRLLQTESDMNDFFPATIYPGY